MMVAGASGRRRGEVETNPGRRLNPAVGHRRSGFNGYAFVVVGGEFHITHEPH